MQFLLARIAWLEERNRELRHTVRDLTSERNMLASELSHVHESGNHRVTAQAIGEHLANTLTAALGFSELARRAWLGPSHALEYLNEAMAAQNLARKATLEMLSLFGASKRHPQPIDINAVTREAGALLDLVRLRKSAIRYELPNHLPQFHGQWLRIRQLISNLLLNAVESVNDTDVIIVRTSIRPFALSSDDEPADSFPEPGQPCIALEICDTGCGMTPQDRARVGELFFSTKPGHDGLGIPASLHVVRSHQGVLRIASKLGRGTNVTVFLPIAVTGDRPTPLPRPPEISDDTAGTILVVDRDPSVARMAQEALEDAGFEVVVADNGAQAEEQIRMHGGNLGLALIDAQTLKQGNRGPLRALSLASPRTPVVLACPPGGAHLAKMKRPQWPVSALLDKPYDISALLDAVRRAVK